jgi:hypothetical protein
MASSARSDERGEAAARDRRSTRQRDASARCGVGRKNDRRSRGFRKVLATLVALATAGCAVAVRDLERNDESTVGQEPDAGEYPPVANQPGTGDDDGAPPSGPCDPDAGPERLPSDLDPTTCLDAGDFRLPPPTLHYALDGDFRNTGARDDVGDAENHGARFAPGRTGQAALVEEEGFLVLTGSGDVMDSSFDVTIALWFKRTDGTIPSTPVISCRTYYAGFETYLGVTMDRLVTCYGCGNDVYPGNCTSADQCDDFWHHLLIRFAPSEGIWDLEVFIDGRPAAAAENRSHLDIFDWFANDLHLGRDAERYETWPPRGGEWLVEDVRVFDDVFDDVEQCVGIAGGRWCDDRCFVESRR